ncbi:MAG TPA: hydroxyacid dehydrogenase [Armatimonadetes bacterium]|nr:hydroxyacid dehydrogenase [Armatimonadota bacterium]
MSTRKTILMGMPRGAYSRTFRASAQDRLWADYDVLTPGERPSTDDLLAVAEGRQVDAVLTVWGAPALPTTFWQAHPECRFHGHMAGSVKHFYPGDTVDHLLAEDIVVVSGQFGLGINVAEATLGTMITLSRNLPIYWQTLRETRGWRVDSLPVEPRGLLGATVGLVGASVIGRLVIEMLKPFRCQVLVYDPYLSAEAAAALGVESVSLEALFERGDIVSMHHPQTPETDRMIGAEQFSRLRDGALFINTARPRAIDPDALLAAAQEQRFTIALDVTEPEPLPADHPLRDLPNVWVTPHVAGCGRYGAELVGDIVIEGLEEFLAGQPVTHRYPLERLATLA